MTPRLNGSQGPEVGQAILPAILPAGALSSAPKPAGKPACSQDWQPRLAAKIGCQDWLPHKIARHVGQGIGKGNRGYVLQF